MVFGPDIGNLAYVSLVLKLFFISFIAFELMLPRFQKIKLEIFWKSDIHSEMGAKTVEAGSFLFSLLFLFALDYMAIDDSGIPFTVSIFLDIGLIISIFLLLFLPKLYGITKDGVYLSGWLVSWGSIDRVEEKEKKVVLVRKGIIWENKSFPLPQNKEKAKDVLREMKLKVIEK